MESLVKFVQDEFVTKKDFPEFGAGDTIHSLLRNLDREHKVRTQFSTGVVIPRRGAGSSETFTIKTMSGPGG